MQFRLGSRHYLTSADRIFNQRRGTMLSPDSECSL